MAKGDIMPFENSISGKMGGSLKYVVASGVLASINAGEPVEKLAGAANVKALVTNAPTATDRIVGVAMSVSTDTVAASGLVDVIPAAQGLLWLIAPKVAATWNTQAKYNALVGARVLIDLTTGVYTILAADGAGNGCIIEYIDISRYPGMVAFSWSSLVDYRNV
jgi:hypothetical protein